MVHPDEGILLIATATERHEGIVSILSKKDGNLKKPTYYIIPTMWLFEKGTAMETAKDQWLLGVGGMRGK